MRRLLAIGRRGSLLQWGLALAAVVCLSSRSTGADVHPVSARLLSNSSAATPGQVLSLGVELFMEEGWHTYWQFSGDAGAPTQVEWGLPEGWNVGPLQWPLPKKYEEQGDLIVYGYAGRTLLISQVQVPDSAVVGDTVSIMADVSWLVCRELCIPGDARLPISLPVGAGQIQHALLFDQTMETVPVALPPEIDLDYSLSDEGGIRRIFIRLGRGVSDSVRLVDFYPLELEDAEFRSYTRPSNRIELSVRPFTDRVIDEVKGVLIYAAAGDEKHRSGLVSINVKEASVVAYAPLLERDFNAEHSGVKHSTIAYVLMGLIGGLILNLMPCVLPVISLKVLSILNQAGEKPHRVRVLGFAFAGGIVASFAALAILVMLLKGAGEQIGWGFQFQYPGFVVLMAALIFALGLSLFGVYHIALPGSNIGFRGGESPSSSFFNGVLATVLATPCTAPFLGTALGFAFAKSAPFMIAIFLSIGVGMALPYVVLALRPGWMRFLPQPGLWMERFKQGMGFLLMGTVLWLLWVLGKQVGSEGIIWAGAFLLGIALACWIVGQWVRLEDSARRRRTVYAGALAVVGASYGLFMHPVLVRAQPLPEVPANNQAYSWIPFTPETVEERVRAGQTVFIDFTAEWCWTCKVNERVVLSQQVLRDRFADDNVAMVKADWTHRNPQITQMLQAFGRSGVPLYVLFPGGQLDAPIVLPELISEEIVLDALSRAAALRVRP